MAPRDTGAQLGFTVVTVHTDEGITGTSLGFGRRFPVAAAHVVAGARDLLVGKDPLGRAALWHEYRNADRWRDLYPVWAYGPVDVALFDIAGKLAGQPVYELLGWYRQSVPVYASSGILASVDDYVAEALAVQAKGLRGYKIHPGGRVEEDLLVYAAVRDAVGDDFPLMCDPVAMYDFDEALRVGRTLERLNYAWFEEPLRDENSIGLKRLSDALEIPVVGTEVLAGAPESVADYLARGVVDAVRGDVSWKGGITGLMKLASLAESLGARCEVHTAIYHPLEIANLHALCAMTNSSYLELLWPLEGYAAGLVGGLDIDADGYAHPPTGPGLGVELDWDLIEDATIATT
jgi:L-alanine-DL-glutamate epimerase-like enolase superfamily enzyme